MGNTKHICYCKGGKGHCKRLSERDKRREALNDWKSLTNNLDRYLSEDACVGELSSASVAEASSITAPLQGFADLIEGLADSRLRNDHQQTIAALRQMGETLSAVMQGAATLIAEERVKNAKSAEILTGEPISDQHRKGLRGVTDKLTAACSRSVGELAEAVSQNHSGAIIHHAALVTDVLYEMLNIALFPIPQCEVATEELLPQNHPHRKILELGETEVRG